MHMFSRLASTTSLDDSKYTTVHTHSLVVSQNLYLWRFAFVLNLSVNLSISNTVAFKLWRKKNTNLSHIVGWRIKCLFSVKSKNSTRTISLMCLLVFAFPLYVRWKFSSHIYLCQMLFSFFISFIFQIWISMFFFSIWFLFCWMNTQHQNMTFKFHRSSIEYHTWMCIAQRSSIHV